MLLSHFVRYLVTGGVVIQLTWCHRFCRPRHRLFHSRNSSNWSLKEGSIELAVTAALSSRNRVTTPKKQKKGGRWKLGSLAGKRRTRAHRLRLVRFLVVFHWHFVTRKSSFTIFSIKVDLPNELPKNLEYLFRIYYVFNVLVDNHKKVMVQPCCSLIFIRFFFQLTE